MGIVVLPHNETEEQVLREFLKDNGYEFFFTETNPDNYHQSLQEYNIEIAEAEAAYERGDSISAEELKKIMLTW